MGTADIIPGISGGTIAFITGIYEDLLRSISNLNPVSLLAVIRNNSWLQVPNILWTEKGVYLITFLGSGILPAIILGSFWVPAVLSSYPHLFFAFCLGCIVFSMVEPARKQVWNLKTALALIIGFLVLIVILLIPRESQQIEISNAEQEVIFQGELEKSSRLKFKVDNLEKGFLQIGEQAPVAIDFDKLREEKTSKLAGEIVLAMRDQTISIYSDQAEETTALQAFFAGALAICAMILPGISGAFILILLDMYIPILLALKSFNIPLILPFILGCLIGILSFVRILSYLLKQYESYFIPGILGIILASFLKLSPWNYADASLFNNMTILIVFTMSFLSCYFLKKKISQ